MDIQDKFFLFFFSLHFLFFFLIIFIFIFSVAVFYILFYYNHFHLFNSFPYFFFFNQGVKVILCLTTRVQIKELFINCSSLYCCYIYQSLYGIQKIMVQQKIECLQWMMVSTLGWEEPLGTLCYLLNIAVCLVHTSVQSEDCLESWPLSRLRRAGHE